MVAAIALVAHSAHPMDPYVPALAAPSRAGAADPRSAALLRRFADGDDTAFETLVGEHQDAAFGFARRLLGDPELARDAVQEAFLRVLRHHRSYDPHRPFRAWLFSIVRNLAIDTLRRRRPQAGEDAIAQVTAPPVADRGELAELRARIAVVLNELPGKYRELLVMREMEGMPAEEIATVIGVDYGTTRWRLHKARELFRTAWRARYGEEEAA